MLTLPWRPYISMAPLTDLRATHNVKQQRAELETAFLIPIQAKEAPGGAETSAPSPLPGSWQQSCSILATSA